jgi:hypothetical protein
VFVLVFGVEGVFGLVPEAANATAGATEMITGTLHPALSSVLLEIPNERSERPFSCDGFPWARCAGSSTLTSKISFPPDCPQSSPLGAGTR